MPERLPEVVDPFGFAEKGRRLKGRLPLSGLDRLVPLLARSEGEVELSLHFVKEGRQPLIEGTVSATLWLTCQCCLESLSWPVASQLSLGIVGSVDEALRLPERFEALVVESEAGILLADLIQDELLLAIPSIPQHPTCLLPGQHSAVDDRPNPFAVLKTLKSN